MLKTSKRIYLIFLLPLVLYFPSLFTFFTHDDFFLLKVSNAQNFHQFLNFFNLFEGPEGLGMYRPLAMQTFYFLSVRFFGSSPLVLHVISFLTFFVLIFAVYKLSLFLARDEKVALVSAFLYATSSSHFAHLYFLGVYQEILVALFVILSVYWFSLYVTKPSRKLFVYSFMCFVGALLSKESFLVTPGLFVLVYIYLSVQNRVKNISLKQITFFFLPFVFLSLIYLYFRFNYFGFPQGDSYVWEISPRVLNTTLWYWLWSMNIPEFVIDFVGPGLKINLEPLRYWMPYLIPLVILVIAQIIFLAWLIFTSIRMKSKECIRLLFFTLIWFLMSLLPVIFLPLHKFAYYLTIPFFAVSYGIACLIDRMGKRFILPMFMFVWIASVSVNILITYKTSWYVNGSAASEKVFEYIRDNKREEDDLYFYEAEEDKNLGWSPAGTLKTILSDNDFFAVFFPKAGAEYGGNLPPKLNGKIPIRARDFLNF